MTNWKEHVRMWVKAWQELCAMCIFGTTVEMYSEGGVRKNEVQQCALAGDKLCALFVN